MTRAWTNAAAAALLLMTSSFAMAADEPDATIEFSGGSAAVGVGAKWGNGTLQYQGKTYPFHLSGISFLDIGGSAVQASGEVYHLAKVEDFTGDYAAASAGAVIADNGTSSASMRNQHGVVIRLHSKTKGAELNASVEGISIKLDGGPQ